MSTHILGRRPTTRPPTTPGSRGIRLIAAGQTAQPVRMQTTLRGAEKVTYFVMGGPGSGKGTQCELLAKHFDFKHFSAGELLRAEVCKKSSQGELIQKLMTDGQIVPAEITVQLLKNEMELHPGPFLIDGFPRSEANYQLFASQVGGCRFVLYLDVPPLIMCERLLKRSETSGRSDDNEDTITKRIRTFEEESLPVIEVLKQQGLVRHISAEPTPERVFQTVKDMFSQDLLCLQAES